MKFTLSWLKDHLETAKPLNEIAAKLNSIGLEVEGIDDAGARLRAFTIARIVEAKKHPNADKLQVVQVEIAKGQPLVEVVCGAPNARPGMISVFAPLGTYIPGSKITLEKKPVRGVVSNGMMCSAAELELPGESDGILDLPLDLALKVGEPYINVMGSNDPVIEVKLTPNRPDCLGLSGLAAEVRALFGMSIENPPLAEVKVAAAQVREIKLHDPIDCPRYLGRVVEGIDPSATTPLWMKERLRRSGVRSISVAVDCSNYVLIEQGQPTHAFDHALLQGGIEVRRAQQGETLKLLDEREVTLNESFLVIADSARAVAVVR